MAKAVWIGNAWEPGDPIYLEIHHAKGAVDLGKIIRHPETKTWWYVSGTKCDLDTGTLDLEEAKTLALACAARIYATLHTICRELYEREQNVSHGTHARNPG